MKSCVGLLLWFTALLFPSAAAAQTFRLELINSGSTASFRALSVVDDSSAWVAGTGGWVGTTRNGGRSWSWRQVPGFENSDFRTLYAFNDKRAVIANAGSPANILLTTDGGLHWKTVYTNEDTAAFIDGVDFWNDREGLIYGDPLAGRMLLLRTSDGGATWTELPEQSRPLLQTGEASFAASGTNIRCTPPGEVIIATGGMRSRLWISSDQGTSFRAVACPIIQEKPSRGIFSVARLDAKRFVVVGGDYLIDTLRESHVLTTRNRGKGWSIPARPTRGYRECVERIREDILIAAGPSGLDVSMDGGATWRAESDEKLFHVVRKARRGSLVLIAGGRGKLAILR